MPNLSTKLAWKYLNFSSKDKSISFMIKICFSGIFIGTFALMMTLAITNGFEKTIHEKMQGINAQVIMYAPGSRLDYYDIANTLEKEFATHLTGISGSSIKQAIIDHNKTQTVIFVKGIDPLNEPHVTNIAEKITLPLPTTSKTQHLRHLLKPGQIIIGYKTAHLLNLSPGDSINLMIPEPGGRKRISLSKERVTIAGIFNIGLEEYDNNFAFTNLNYANQIFDEKGVDTISLNFKPIEPPSFSQLWHQHKKTFSFSLLYSLARTLLAKIKYLIVPNTANQDIMHKLQLRFPNLTIQSWQELYPALVSSLKLEKYVMFFIIALVTLVAAMNMISLLFMQVQQKRRDIAIYKAMGMNNATIQGIFLRLGMIITTTASTCGLISAGLVGYALECYPFIQLPDVYYVSHLPARLDPELFVVVFVTTLLLGFIATWLPARRARRVNVAQVLRQE